MRVFVRGLPQTLVVDDYIPFANWGYGYYAPLFAQQSSDGAIWGMLTEKVWAKYNGVYDNLEGGWPLEFYDFVGGVPSIEYSNTDASTVNTNGLNAYNYISTALNNSYAVGTSVAYCNGAEYNSVGIVCGHAYTITNTCKIYGSSGAVTNYLIHIRNPWGTDTDNLNWADGDTTHWTTANKAQCGYVNNTSDGDFWVDANDYVNYFDEFQIGYFIDSYVHNVLDIQGDTGTTNTYYFNLTKTANTFVGVQYYNPRMYPLGCHSETYGYMYIYTKSGTLLYQGWAEDWQMFSYYNANLTAGQYKIVIQTTWESTDKTDYTVKVYGAENVTITDAGNSSRKSWSFAASSNYTATTTNTTTTNTTTTNTTTTNTTTTTPTAPSNSTASYNLAGYYLQTELAWGIGNLTSATKTSNT